MNQDNLPLASKIDHIFPENRDDLDEEIALIKNCESSLYKKAVGILDLFMKLISVKLQESNYLNNQSISTFGSNRKLFTVDSFCCDPPILLKNIRIFRYLFENKWIRGACLTAFSYVWLKFMIISVFRYRYAVHLKNWHTNLPNITRMGNCALVTDIPALPREIENTNLWLEYLGDPTTSRDAFPFLTYQYVCICSLYLYGLNLLLLIQRQVPFDSLNFILDPIAERDRVREEIDQISQDLIKVVTTERLQRKFKGKKQFQTNILEEELALILNSKQLAKSVKPANLTPDWHNKLIRISLFLLTMVTSSLFIGSIYVFYIPVYELISQANHRLDLIQCEKWNTDGKLITHLGSLRISLETTDNEAFLNYDGKLSSFLYLAFFVMPRYSFNFKTILSTLQLLITLSLTSICFQTQYFFFLIFMVDRFVRQSQLAEQLNWCKNHFRTLNPLDKQESALIIRQLKITYCNYILYVKQSSNFLNSLRVLLVPMLVASLKIILISYLIGFYWTSKFSYASLWGLTFMMLMINMYLICIASMYTKLCRMMKSISELAALSVETLWMNEPILKLWRKQLLEKSDLERLFSLHLFGNHISMTYVITLDIYFICFWMFLIKSNLL